MFKIDETYTREFCGKQVNVKDYCTPFEETVADRQRNASFIRYSWLDISSYTVDDERLSNLAVRAEQNIGISADDIAHSYEIEGWDMSYFPPIVGTDGVPRDGRTRIIAALKCGQKFIPCAIYSYKDNDSIRSNKSNALIANKHKTQVRAQWKDFVASGVAIIQSKEMPCDMTAIYEWLYNEVDIEYFYSNTGGNITKIAKQIYERASRGSDLLTLRKREEWLNWLETSISKYSLEYQHKYGIKDINDIQFYESGGSRADHVFCKHILPNAAAGKITNLVIYSMNDDSEKTKFNHLDFVNQLNEYHSNVYEWINKELSGIRLSKPNNCKLWRIVGVIPQLQDDKHKNMIKRHILADMSDFRLIPPISSLLDINEEYMDEAA
jgi:hypothetical protein